MAEIDKSYLDKRFEIIAEKISRFEKTLDLRTKDFDEIIKESLDSNYKIIKMIQEEVRNQNQKIESLQTHLNGFSKAVNSKIGTAIQENLGDSADILAKVSGSIEKQEAKITAAAATIEKTGKEIGFETKQLDTHIKEALDRNSELLKSVRESQDGQSTTITSIHKNQETFTKDIDYRLRQSESSVNNAIEESTKALKMLQDDVYGLKKSADLLTNNLQMMQKNIQDQVKQLAETINTSLEKNFSRFDLIQSDIAHLAGPFSRIDEHIELLSQKVRSQRIFFFVTIAVVVMVMVGSSFLFDRNNRARFLDIQQAYQQFYSVNRAGNIEVSKGVRDSADSLTTTSMQQSERIISTLDKKIKALNRDHLARVKTSNRKMSDTIKEENRKLLSILDDQNEHQMRVIEKLLQQYKEETTAPEEPSPPVPTPFP